MIKFMLALALCLGSGSAFAEDGDKDSEASTPGAVHCANFKDGKCLDAAGEKANCCVVNTIGGVDAPGGKLTDGDTTPSVSGSNSGSGSSSSSDKAQ
jgi:hypothetical protein